MTIDEGTSGDGRSDFGHNPFAKLRGDGAPAPRRAAEPQRSAGDASGGSVTKPSAKLVVRREKAGRGGKTVTRVQGLAERGDALQELAREMKRALGCGASVEGDDVVLQGALTDRAAAFLVSRFGAKVTIGN